MKGGLLRNLALWGALTTGVAACGPGVDRAEKVLPPQQPVAQNCAPMDPNNPAVVTVREKVAAILQRVRVANGLGNQTDLEAMRAQVKEALKASINIDLVAEPIVTFTDIDDASPRELIIDPELGGTVQDLVSAQLQDGPSTVAGPMRFTPLARATIADKNGQVWFDDQEIGVAAQFGVDYGSVIDQDFSHQHAATAFMVGLQPVIHGLQAPVFTQRESVTFTTESASGNLSVSVDSKGGEQNPYILSIPPHQSPEYQSDAECLAWDGTDSGPLVKFCGGATCDAPVAEMKTEFDQVFKL